jgi:flagellum-specific ATP synthase
MKPDPRSLATACAPGLLAYRQALRELELTRRMGWVRQVQGLAIQAQGPDATVGELCRIRPRLTARDASSANGGADAGANAGAGADAGVLAEVVGLHAGHVTLLPYGSLQGVSAGAEVVALGRASTFGVGPAQIGRVIDGFGEPLDGGARPATVRGMPLHGAPINPMKRPSMARIIETGIRAIDGLLTLGQGQRVGIFAGSGVGKSTLLGMIARHVKADINVIALIGERGREVRDFIDKQLGPEGLRRSIVVVATADQPALARIRAAHAAVAIAEYFRDEGRQVLLTMDSVTRLAMARREVGLSAGEPPTARGYTPSVFAELPQLCERFGTSDRGGAITALLTVLVEGDDFNEPISDNLRAILDGHIVLSRSLAHTGQYPAIDVLQSTSRLRMDLTDSAERELVNRVTRHISLVERNRQMVEIGAYEAGTNPLLDQALRRDVTLREWMTQREGGFDRPRALEQLRACMAEAAVVPAAGPGAKTGGAR